MRFDEHGAAGLSRLFDGFPEEGQVLLQIGYIQGNAFHSIARSPVHKVPRILFLERSGVGVLVVLYNENDG